MDWIDLPLRSRRFHKKRYVKAHVRPAALFFWYCQGPDPLVNRSVWFVPGYFKLPGWVTPTDPPMTEAGMTALALDLKGRLLEFHDRTWAMPLSEATGWGAATAPGWR